MNASTPEVITQKSFQSSLSQHRDFIKWHGKQLLTSYEELSQAADIDAGNLPSLQGLKQSFVEAVVGLKQLDLHLLLAERNSSLVESPHWAQKWKLKQDKFQKRFVRFVGLYRNYKSIWTDHSQKSALSLYSHEKI